MQKVHHLLSHWGYENCNKPYIAKSDRQINEQVFLCNKKSLLTFIKTILGNLYPGVEDNFRNTSNDHNTFYDLKWHFLVIYLWHGFILINASSHCTWSFNLKMLGTVPWNYCFIGSKVLFCTNVKQVIWEIKDFEEKTLMM